MESQELSDIPSFSQSLSEAEIKKIEDSLRLDVDNEAFCPKDNDSLASYLDSFRNVGLTSSVPAEDRTFDALFRLQQQDQELHVTSSNSSNFENVANNNTNVSFSQHSQQQQRQHYYQPSLNRPQLHEFSHSLLPPAPQHPSSLQGYFNQPQNQQHHNMYNKMVSSQLGNSFPQPKFGNNIGSNHQHTTNVSSHSNLAAINNGGNISRSGITVPPVGPSNWDTTTASIGNSNYDWLATNQLDAPFSHPYIRSLPVEGVRTMTQENNQDNNSNNNSSVAITMPMMMMPSAYIAGGRVSSYVLPDCNNGNNNIVTPPPDYYEAMKNNGNNSNGDYHNSGGRNSSGNSGGSVGDEVMTTDNLNQHLYSFHQQQPPPQQKQQQQQQHMNASFPMNMNNGTKRLNDFQMNLHNIMMTQQQQQQQQQQQFSSQSMPSFPMFASINNFAQQQQQQQQYQQLLQNAYHGGNDSTVQMHMNHNLDSSNVTTNYGTDADKQAQHHQQQLVTSSAAAALTALSGSGMMTGGSGGLVGIVKRCRSVLDGTDNEDVEDESAGDCRLGSSRSNSSVSASYDEDEDRYRSTTYIGNSHGHDYHTTAAVGMENGNGMNEVIHSSPSKMKNKMMRVDGVYTAASSSTTPRRLQQQQQQQENVQQDKAPSKIRYEWKTHFAALLHFCAAHGHCKVPRTLEYTCEVPYISSMTSFSSPILTAPVTDCSVSHTGSDGIYENSSNGITNDNEMELNVIHNVSSKSVITDTSSSTTNTTINNGVNNVSSSQSTILYTGKLGRWLDDQRKARKGKRTKLTPEREAMLQRLVDEGKLLWDATELKPNEINKKRGDLNWPRAYAALLKFGEIHGHYNVPKRGNFRCELPDMPDENGSIIYDAKLGNWLYWQRELKKGRRCGLASERESQLQSLADQGKLTWDVSDMNASQRSQQRGDTSWPRAFQALLVYGEEEGDYNVPNKKVYQCLLPNGDVYSANLGNWLNGQRKLKKSNAPSSSSSSSGSFSSSSSSSSSNSSSKGNTGQPQLPPEREKLLQNLADQGKFNW